MKKDAKDHARNRLMDCYIKKAPTYAAIVKIEHFENDDASSKDFEPFVVYSLNKKKRWEINEESLNSSTEGCLQNDLLNNCIYHSNPVNSAQMATAKKYEKVIGYHIVRIPVNHKKVFDKKCTRDLSYRYRDSIGNVPRDLTVLQYEMKEVEHGKEDFAKENISPEVNNPSKTIGFYNLEEHFVARKQQKSKGWLTVN
ncbi:Ubiquitinyl hydrolase 1 [Caenorhabditis elegans]|uniref:Ubiquitinyl hydrolase 1 n=1 Tax=Caenorhabditis elegans TaxID=6239 RepID=O45351_CAEEL|nr:Ubiquitinyl hydrolase 1 [Caenorhabditis elegans]CAB07571.2 Ubiquitinyl hydrolase 1 [Caenorhabditis elegans]|eukprot:NP_507144.2 Uncharacterized protein CELE_F13A7.11 [Caenorhabditis elegans]